MNTIQEEQTPCPEIEEPPALEDNMKITSMYFLAPPGLEDPPKKKTRQPNREYMREYYHKHKADIACPFCNMVYTCKSSLVKHQRRSTKCAIQRIHNTFSDFTESDCRIRDYLHKHEMEEQLKLLQRLANKNNKTKKAEMT